LDRPTDITNVLQGSFILSDNKETLTKKMDFLMDVIKRYDHYIGTTNFKVGLMMSFLVTIILGLTVMVMKLPSPHIEKSCVFNIIIAVSIATIITALIGIYQLFNAAFPNISSPANSKSLIFFGDVCNSENGAEGYLNQVLNSSMKELAKDIATQTFTVAEIVSEKFRILRLAVNIIKWGVMPLLALSLILIITTIGN